MNVATTLKSHRAELVTLDSTVTRLQAELRVAEERRKELQISVRVCETLLEPSPLRRLPTEVISEILCAYSDSLIPAQDEAEDIAISFVPKILLAQLRAAQNLPLQVCRRWSDIACSTPRYWKLQLVLYPPTGMSDAHRAEHWKRTEDRLHRARDTPLFVVLSLGPEHHSNVVDDREWMRLFAECAKRTESLVLITRRPRNNMDPSKSIPQTHLPHLRQLILGHDYSLLDPSFNIQNFKNLQSCSITGPLLCNVSSKTITRLHCYRGAIEFKQVREIISAMPQLLHLCFPSVIDAETLPTPQSHSNILSLVLGHNGSSILHNYRFPKLQYLNLITTTTTSDETGPWPHNRDIAFFEHSQQLEHLTLMGNTGFSDALSKVLYILPALRTVDLCGMSKRSGNPLPSAFLDAFAKRSRRQCPIPPWVVKFAFPEIPMRQVDRFHAALEGIAAKRTGHALKHIGAENNFYGLPGFKEAVDQLLEAGIMVDSQPYEPPRFEE